MTKKIQFKYPKVNNLAAGTANQSESIQLSEFGSTNYSSDFLNNAKNFSTDKKKWLLDIGYHPMDSEMDDAYFSLYNEFFSVQTIDIDDFVSRCFPEFKNAAVAYFTRHPIVSDLQENFFYNLTGIWGRLRTQKRLGQAQQFWDHVLSLTIDLEKLFDKRIHKGSIYYFWGGTAIENGEIEKGYRLMASALLQDEDTEKSPKPDTPAYRFVYFGYKDPRQHFSKLLQDQGQVLESYLPKYHAQFVSDLDGPKFLDRFVVVHPNPEAVLLLVYSIARIEQQQRYRQESPENVFAGILDLNLLFDLTLVLELSIKAKAKKHEEVKDFYNCAAFLSKSAKLNLVANHLDLIIEEREKDKNIATTINNLLNHSFKPRGDQLSPIEMDIAIAYLIRNHAAHNIDPQSLVPMSSQNLLQSLFNVLFLTVDTLY